MDRSGARQNQNTDTMKSSNRVVRWGGLLAVVGLVWTMSPTAVQGGDTKPFKETGMEYFVTSVTPGSFEPQLFVEARARHGMEVWAGVILQVSHNNVGGAGSGLALEAVYLDPGAPKGVVVYAVKYEVVANGDQLVMAGSFVPQADGSLLADFGFLPAECTGRFAGATGTIPGIRAIPGPGYVFEGTITTVGATK